MFITTACGTCSGFHGVVSSGTTSKQVSLFKDSLLIGYGAILLAVALWLIKSGKKAAFVLWPMAFMLVMTLWSLINFVTPFLAGLLLGGAGTQSVDARISGVWGRILLALSFALIWETIKILFSANLLPEKVSATAAG